MVTPYPVSKFVICNCCTDCWPFCKVTGLASRSLVISLLAGCRRRRKVVITTTLRFRGSSVWGPPIFVLNWYRSSFPGVKRPGREGKHSSPSSAKVKMSCAVPVLTVCLGVGRENFTFTCYLCELGMDAASILIAVCMELGRINIQVVHPSLGA
jgi:hypothetical protein